MLWHPPLETNGGILSYSIYYRVKGGEPKTARALRFQRSYEIQELETNKTYEFWVTASNKHGEGRNSMYITRTTSEHIAPQISTYGEEFTIVFKQIMILPCEGVGSPVPRITWKV